MNGKGFFSHGLTQTKAGQKLVSHIVHRDTETNLFITVLSTAMKNQPSPGGEITPAERREVGLISPSQEIRAK
jgi:hypothetical protein